MTDKDDAELYYVEMESARHFAEEAYFAARPHTDSLHNRTLFKAGYERAFAALWHQRSTRTSEGK